MQPVSRGRFLFNLPYFYSWVFGRVSRYGGFNCWLWACWRGCSIAVDTLIAEMANERIGALARSWGGCLLRSG